METFSFFRLLFISTLTILVSEIPAQDIHFSQFAQNPLNVNPAQAGTTTWVRGLLEYRTQWRAVTVPYKTIDASCDMKVHPDLIKKENVVTTLRPVAKKEFGVGVNVLSDKAGDGNMGTLQANFTGSYHIKNTEKSLISLGLQAGFIQRSINFGKLHWGNQYDSSQPTGYNPAIDPKENYSNYHFIIPDVSAGLFYVYKKNEQYMFGKEQMDIMFGTAIYHINHPKYSLSKNEKLYSRYVVHGQGIIGIPNTNMAVVPGIMYTFQYPNQELFFGTMFRHMFREDSRYTNFIKGSAISAGGYYRNKDAVVLATFWEFTNYGIGISYDINLSGLKAASTGRGGLEFTLRYLNPSPFYFNKGSL